MATIRHPIFIYVIIFLASYAMFCPTTLKSEYLFMKIAEAHNTTKKQSSCSNHSQSSDVDALITKEVSQWSLHLNTVLLLPASFSSIFITSWGDRVGRKVTISIPLLGFIIGNLIFTGIIYFNWSLYVFYLSNFISGIGGFYLTMVIQGAGFISDITPQEKRGQKFVILEACLGIAGGVSGVTGGYWVKASGFLQPIFFSAVLDFVSLLLVFLLPDSREIRKKKEKKQKAEIKRIGLASELQSKNQIQSEPEDSSLDDPLSPRLSSHDYGSCCTETSSVQRKHHYTVKDLIRGTWRIYSSDYSHCDECHGESDSNRNSASKSKKCVHPGRGFPGRRWRMWTYLAAQNLYLYAYVGTSAMEVIYFLAKPLCLTSTLIGVRQGLTFTLYALSPLLVVIYQRCFALSNNVIALIGIGGLMANVVITSFASNPQLVFIGTFPVVFTNTTVPFILAQISGMVLASEQGSAFAMTTFFQTFTTLIASLSFLSLYSGTVQVYRGIAWLFAGGVLLLPILLITIVIFKDRTRKQTNEVESEPLVT